MQIMVHLLVDENIEEVSAAKKGENEKYVTEDN